MTPPAPSLTTPEIWTTEVACANSPSVSEGAKMAVAMAGSNNAAPIVRDFMQDSLYQKEPMRTTCLLLCLTELIFAAGPVEFGRAELQKAIHDRGLRDIRLEESIQPGAPESYAIAAGKVSGSDPRGLMYGLLEAAEQIRLDGKVTPVK